MDPSVVNEKPAGAPNSIKLFYDSLVPESIQGKGSDWVVKIDGCDWDLFAGAPRENAVLHVNHQHASFVDLKTESNFHVSLDRPSELQPAT